MTAIAATLHASPAESRAPQARPEPCAPHPVLRGDFATLVFCGRLDQLLDLAGEPTAATHHKFALIDPRLKPAEDFARCPGMSLPLWPPGDGAGVRPTDGVCFVFSDRENPLILEMINAGGVEHEHFAILGASFTLDDALNQRAARLAAFVRTLPKGTRFLILGYGQQGASIANEFQALGVARSRIAVHDRNLESAARALDDGFSILDAPAAVEPECAVIYSPLASYDRLLDVLQRSREAGHPCFDNRRASSGLTQFTRRGRTWLDGAADRALTVEGDRITPRPHGLPLSCSVIRQERRTLNGATFPHLHGPRCCPLSAFERWIDVAAAWPDDAPAASTSAGFEAAYISLRQRADLDFFAAREFCARLWPQANVAVFPSRHAIDLGATALERRLRDHLDGRDIVPAMLTPMQRVALGIAAAHYAADRPIVEVGSALGGSMLLLAAATSVHRPALYSIDPDASTRDIMRFALGREGHLDRLTQITKTSDDAIGELQHLKGRCGLVFIDGLHTPAAVAADFENYAPLVGRGGALVFHDVVPALYGVMHVVMQRVLTDRRFRAICLVDGLMVLERVE